MDFISGCEACLSAQARLALLMQLGHAGCKLMGVAPSAGPVMCILVPALLLNLLAELNNAVPHAACT